MKRRTFDIIASTIGLALAVLLFIAGGLLTWAHGFIHDQVHSQLAAQKIFFPPAGSDSIKGPEFAPMQRYAGQQLVTGQQAQVYADHFIAIHLKEIGGGLTYAQLSSKALADPTNTKLQAQVDTMFKGTTLRSMLLNAYAWDKSASIANDAALVAYVGGGVLLVLGGLGFWHSRRTPEETEFLTGAHESISPEKV